MIYITFVLHNPWSNRHQIVANKVFSVTENKSIEIGLYRNSCIIEFSFTIRGLKQDHAGLGFDIGLFGYNFDFSFYDNRHYYE